MEKRILVASILSLLILVGYNAIITKRYHLDQPKSKTLGIAANVSQPAPLPRVEIQPLASGRIPLEYKELETKKLKLVFTNLGGAISQIWLKDYNTKFFVSPVLGFGDMPHLPFQFAETTADSMLLIFQDAQRRITKKFQVVNDYFIKVEIISQETAPKEALAGTEFNCFSLNPEALNKDPQWQKEKTLAEVSFSLPEKIFRTNISRINSRTSISQSEKVNWLGLRDRYFCVIFKPELNSTGYFLRSQTDKTLFAGLIFAKPAGTLKGILYIGPQNGQILSSANAGFEQIVNFGAFDAISRFMLKIIGFFHNFMPNWGLCIIAFGVLIFLALYPLTFKSLKSMREMQKLQPQIEALKKQYQKDPQRLNKEIMELYRIHKVNPFGGCLPLLLQIPVFFALYQALLRSADLKGSNFLWIKDLSEPDRLMVFSSSLPFIGNELNILPIVMAITMFFQQKISSKNMPAADPQQQKFMLIFFPILFGIMFYRFPSGLALYWAVYSLLSLAFQWKQTPTHHIEPSS